VASGEWWGGGRPGQLQPTNSVQDRSWDQQKYEETNRNWYASGQPVLVSGAPGKHQCPKRIIATRTFRGMKIYQKCSCDPGYTLEPAGAFPGTHKSNWIWEGKIGKERGGEWKRCCIPSIVRKLILDRPTTVLRGLRLTISITDYENMLSAVETNYFNHWLWKYVKCMN